MRWNVNPFTVIKNMTFSEMCCTVRMIVSITLVRGGYLKLGTGQNILGYGAGQEKF